MSKKKKIKLLPHEQVLINNKLLENNTHKNSSYIWLFAPSTIPSETQTTVYRVIIFT